MRGKRVLVAGGAGTIGCALVAGFQQAGAQVVAVDANGARLVVLDRERGLTDSGGGVVEADLRDRQACRRSVIQAQERLGGLDVFVHALGLNVREPIEQFTQGDWDDIITTNLSSAFWMMQVALGTLRDQRHGRVVLLSSVAGRSGHKHHGPYAASKGAVNQLTRVAAHEYAGDGVTVNAVAPGYMETALTRRYLDEDRSRRDELIRLIPAGRLGTIDEVVGPVLFLASRQAGFITGQIVYVDGGRTII